MEVEDGLSGIKKKRTNGLDPFEGRSEIQTGLGLGSERREICERIGSEKWKKGKRREVRVRMVVG